MEPREARIPYQACPLCDAPPGREAMVADCTGHELYKPALPARQRWLQCAKCGHVHVDGYFTPEALALVFSATNENQTPGYDVEGQRDLWARVVDSVAAVRGKSAGRWLDIGFGNGALLMTAAEYGFDVAGLDLRSDSVARMRAFGFEAHAIALEDYRPAHPFGVVSMADVLEHMPFPRPALRRVRELLEPAGVLFLSMPNMDATVWRMLTETGANPYWGEIEHYHNFGRRRLYALLEECGFAPVRYGVSNRYRACMEVIARRM
jgi:SAM-dependent methyltransferase